MHKQIALAYSIAGIAVAVALLVTYGSQAQRAVDAVPPPADVPAEPAAEEGAEQPVEYVYVDAPKRSGRGHHDDDDDGHEDREDHEDEHEAHEAHERSEHRERESE